MAIPVTIPAAIPVAYHAIPELGGGACPFPTELFERLSAVTGVSLRRRALAGNFDATLRLIIIALTAKCRIFSMPFRDSKCNSPLNWAVVGRCFFI